MNMHSKSEHTPLTPSSEAGSRIASGTATANSARQTEAIDTTAATSGKQDKAIDTATSTSGQAAEVIDTAKIQAALEKRADQETAALPRLTVPDISEDPSSPDPEPATGHTTDLSGEIRTARQISESRADKKTFFKKRSTGHSLRERWWDPSVRSWFYTFMCMNMPVVGWFYLVHEAKHEEDPQRKEFARAYLFYKLVFLIAGLVVLLILLWIGLGLLDQLLAYMEML